MCAEAWGALSLVHIRIFIQSDFSILLLFRQCVDARIQRNSSLHWTQIHTVPCPFVLLGLSAIARTFLRASNVPVDPLWTQTANATSGNAHGKGRREMWSQGEEGLAHESMTIFSGPLWWHGALINSFAFFFLLSFPQQLMVGKFLNWSPKEGVSSKGSQHSVPVVWQVPGQQGNWAVSSRQQLVRSCEQKTVPFVVPLFSAFTCLLQQAHSPVWKGKPINWSCKTCSYLTIALGKILWVMR